MEHLQTVISHLPHSPGVYIYRDGSGQTLYIGKAKDLNKRVSQYWKRDAIGPKTKLLVSQIAGIETIRTASEFDALLLEAKLIHDVLPKYNVILKDDKSPLYILLTLSENLPHVKMIRRSDIPKKLRSRDALFGPFQTATVVRSMMRHLRHTIPYCTQKRRTGKPCFYTHLGLCHPCPSAIEGMQEGEAKTSLVHEYRTNILRLKQLLSGKSGRVTRDLTKQMEKLAAKQRFEEAATVRTHIQHLYRICQKSYDPMLYVSSDAAVEDIYANELSSLQQQLAPYLAVPRLTRIECIDISNTQGKYATGSFVVLTDGRSDTSAYKRFRIRLTSAPNDVAMIGEVVARRFLHTEWQLPDLLIIDGGKGQVKAALQALSFILSERQRVEGSPSITIPVIGLAKRFEEIIIPLPHNRWKTLRLDVTSPGLHLTQRIRDEAHRFALSYHRLLRSRQFVTMSAT
ncbi:GIY-YIG nuclease family protein [Candidatus Gottesmanbacteria bacterium]|nr:GIY-YIG nuclease family protein [Candidatus Gottesmanbacteria bacterium]